MRINKNWEWVRDFMDEVEHLLPKLKRVKILSFRRAKRGQITRADGITNYYTYSRTYHITIHTSYCKVQKVGEQPKMKPFSMIDILTTLAHELAHLEHWDHTPEHKVLECKLLNRFMKRLKRLGYVSEEDELQST